MAEVKWIKITTDMFDDEKIKLIESMPERDTVLTIWIKLICLAGRVRCRWLSVNFLRKVQWRAQCLIVPTRASGGGTA